MLSTNSGNKIMLPILDTIFITVLTSRDFDLVRRRNALNFPGFVTKRTEHFANGVITHQPVP